MAQINFGNTIDMLNIATPSSGYIIGYDLDGVLKQKDSNGIIIEIGGGPTAGSGTSSLSAVLSTGNNTGVYSIIMGTSTYIASANGGGQISLDLISASAVSISTDNGSLNETYLTLSPDSVELNYNYSTSQTILSAGTSGNVYINAPEELSININDVDFIKSGMATVSSPDTAKTSTIISSRNSTVLNNVQNSVIVGGQNLTASQNDTVT